MIDVILLGTGSPLPDPNRAGPATLVRVGATNLLVDAGRGVLMRLAAAGVGAGMLDAVLITHLHSDHITDLNDVITSRWVTSFAPAPLTIVGPPGTRAMVDGILAMLGADIGYRLDHHEDLTWEPPVDVIETVDGPCWKNESVTVTAGPTDHRPVHPTIGFRISHEGHAVAIAGDTVPCAGLDALADGADALVHTAIRKDLLGAAPVKRLQDVLDYHSSVEQAAQTASRAGVGTLVLTHFVPALGPGDDTAWRELAQAHFDGPVEVGEDLHRVTIGGEA